MTDPLPEAPSATGFGFALWSRGELDLPELPLRHSTDLLSLEVRLIPGARDQPHRDAGQEPSVRVTSDPRTGVFSVTATGYGEVALDPAELRLTCDPWAAQGRWQDLFVAQSLPLMAILCGSEAMHASAVVIDDKAVLITAPSGAGKTTLAAYMAVAGAPLLADDVVVLRTSPIPGTPVLACPSGGLVHLGADDAEALSGPRLNQVGFREGKVSCGVQTAAAPVDVGTLILLSRSTAERPLSIEPVHAVPPQLLLGSTFNPFVRTPTRLLQQLDTYQALAGTAKVLSVQVGRQTGPAELAQVLSGHISGSS